MNQTDKSISLLPMFVFFITTMTIVCNICTTVPLLSKYKYSANITQLKLKCNET